MFKNKDKDYVSKDTYRYMLRVELDLENNLRKKKKKKKNKTKKEKLTSGKWRRILGKRV